jgi:hypothetical protein
MAISSPAVPASTVAQLNDTGQFVNVALTGFTLTSVVVNGTQVGTTNANYALPPGGSIAVTYTVAGTWAWTVPNEEGLGYTPTYSAENLRVINEIGDLPWPAHAEGGESGLGEAVSN